MKKALKLSFILLFALSISETIFAQSTGLDLYTAMGQRGFTQVEGTFGLQWLPGDLGYMEVEQDQNGNTVFYKVNPKNEKRTPLFDDNTSSSIIDQFNTLSGKKVTGVPFNRFNFVQDDKAILFTDDGTDYLFNLKDKELKKLYKPTVERPPYTDELMRGMQFSQLWNGTYSHDYSKFAYVKEYDIYIVDTATKTEKRLTYGSEEKMNGRPSWVYPEEFGERDAYWFSPDNTKIAYLQYDETDVHQYPIIHDIDFEAGLELERYPKAGEVNPTVNLFIVDIASGKIEQVPTKSDPDTYIVRPIWRNDGSELTFRRLNRQQNNLELLAYSIESKSLRTILTEKEDAYVKLHDNFIQLEDNDTFLWTSERSGYNQVYRYNFDGTLMNALTSGDAPVGRLINIDQKKKKIYFTRFENLGLDSYFYSVGFDGKKMKKLSKEAGRHFISMNDTGTYYVDRFSSFDTPTTANLYQSNGKMVRNLLSTNIENIEQNNLQKPELITFKAADGETDLVGLVYKPTNFDPNKKYPVVLPLYGGPESQDVSNTYKSNDGYQRLAQLGFIVVRANYRGSGNRGKKFATMHYKNLGTLEIDDYAQAIKEVTKRPYADGSRVGVYGHSYGGFSTSMLMLRYPEIFHVGIAGAPVTDWRSYDTIYTERYMDTPQNNLSGYDTGSALTYADKLKGKLLLIHGSTDNNVHPGNTIHLIDALVRADKRFDMMFYPENRHGIRGPHGLHYNKMRMEYLVNHLSPETKNAFLSTFNWSNDYISREDATVD